MTISRMHGAADRLALFAQHRAVLAMRASMARQQAGLPAHDAAEDDKSVPVPEDRHAS